MADLVQNCRHCASPVEFRRSNTGKEIFCPHCGKKIALGEGATPVRKSSGLVALALIVIFVISGVSFILQRPEVPRKTPAQSPLEPQPPDVAAPAKSPTVEVRVETNAVVAIATEASKPAIEEKDPEEAARIARARANPKLWEIWNTKTREKVRVTATRPNDITMSYGTNVVVAKYDDLPDWLRAPALARHRQEGESKGLIREVDGKTYDLRTAPAGWIGLPSAEVTQILDDGYLMIDGSSARGPRFFKLRHNGLSRILNVGDRVQVTAMAVGTYTYENRRLEKTTIPLYDPGMPVGPLKSRVVSMHGSGGRDSRKSPTPTEDSGITTGSGFFISDDGLFVSNAHVVEDAKKVEVKTAAGKKPATVLQVDRNRDLALLRVSVAPGAVSALTISSSNLALGTQVFTIGYPLVEVQGSRPKYTDGKISSIAGIRDNPDEMQISVSVQPGNSGGPLADMNGDVVGVVVARLDDITVLETSGLIPQNVNYAIKASTLMRFLNDHKSLTRGIGFGRPAKRTSEEAIQRVEKASGLVLAYEKL